MICEQIVGESAVLSFMKIDVTLVLINTYDSRPRLIQILRQPKTLSFVRVHWFAYTGRTDPRDLMAVCSYKGTGDSGSC